MVVNFTLEMLLYQKPLITEELRIKYQALEMALSLTM